MICQLSLFTNFKFKRTLLYAGLVCMFITLKHACMHACSNIFHTWIALSYFHFCENVAHSDYVCAAPWIPLTVTHSSVFGKWHGEVKVFACQESFKQFAIISIASSLPASITNKVTHMCSLYTHAIRAERVSVLEGFNLLTLIGGQKLQKHI